mgnify:CR=1 FL=1
MSESFNPNGGEPLEKINGQPIDIDVDAEINDADAKAVSASKIKPKKDHFWTKIIFFMLAIILLRLFVIDPFLVNGSSMEPTFEDGDYVIVDKLSYQLRAPARGEVIVFDAPTNDGRYFIKRIIGLPGERVVVDGTSVTIFNKENPNGFKSTEPYVKFTSNRKADRTLASDEYFVMGDNREVSSDSRIWGPLHRSAIEGRALVRLLPLKTFGITPGSTDEFPGVNLPK